MKSAINSDRIIFIKHKEDNGLDKELMNSAPEEENNIPETAENAEEITEAVEESTEETVEETQAEEAEENIEETAEAEEAEEDTAESEEESVDAEGETPEEEEEYELCPVCGENRVTEGSDYCGECEAVMLKRKPPFLAWVCGAAVLLLSVFALVISFLVSAPAIQVIKGDTAAKNNCWYTAFLEYSEVDTVVSEVNSILGTSALNNFVQTGSNVKLKLINAVAKYSNPLDAYSYASNYFTEEEIEKIPTLLGYKNMQEAYTVSYDTLYEGIEMLTSGESTYEEVVAKFESFRGTEGVEDVFVDYFVTAAASYFRLSDEEQLLCFEKIDASAKASGKDYRWLYYIDYANMLNDAGESEKAIALLDEIIAEDNTAYDYYALKMKIQISDGDLEAAEKTCTTFEETNEGYETAYILRAVLLRCQGETSEAKELVTEALETYGTVPELYRQLALIYLLEGDYDNAYEQAYTAYLTAYNRYYYYGDSNAYTVELDNTVYICAYLCNKLGEMTTENAVYITDILSSYEGIELSDQLNSIISGEKTVQEVLTEGECDLV